MRAVMLFASAIIFGGILAAGLALASAPDANRGKDLVGRRCMGCHSVDGIKAAPPLRGAFGRAAGRVAPFPYSDALKGARVTWDDATLDKWLTDPESVVPGNDMSFRLDNASERADIIAYLKQLR
jgi:cytochrome c